MTSRQRPRTYAVVILVLAGLVLLGVAAFAQRWKHGDTVTGLRTIGAGGAVWGLYVVLDGFLLSAGTAVMAVACAARLSRDRDMEAVARIAMPIAVTCFLGAALCVAADQGRPLVALANLSRYARPQSPFFVTFTSVIAVCLYGSLLHCVLARRPDLAEYAKRPSFWQPFQRLLAAGYTGTPGECHRRQKVGFWMSFLMLPALFVTLAALTVIFAVRPGRPLLSTLLEVGAFIFLAGAGGIGFVAWAGLLVGHFAGRAAGLPDQGFARLGRVLLALTSASLFLAVAAEVVGVVSHNPSVSKYASALLGEDYGVLFWGEIGGLVLAVLVLLASFARRALGSRVVALAGLLVLAALFLQRYLLLVAWQTHGLALPYPPGSYCPTLVECLVAVGILALCLLLLLPSVRLIPFRPLTFESHPTSAVPEADLLRTIVTGFWLSCGLALTVAGFALSNRLGRESFEDPILPGSPMLFVLGLVVLASTGGVYELLPERKSRAMGPR